MIREKQLDAVRQPQEWDIVIAGGGATGLGAALDAASRGYRTLLVERYDFAKGTSSRSTKLIHGGVRYLEQGNLRLVRSALRERWFFLRNASPALAQPVPFILPVYSTWKLWYFWIGLKLYDLLSGRLSLGATRRLSAEAVLQLMPSVRNQHLKGGVMYFDGQFDDAGMCLALAHTASQHGAVLVNYCEATAFRYAENGKINGMQLRDNLRGEILEIRTRAVINATGVFADALMQADDPSRPSVIRPSQGIHLVADARFFQGEHALLIPRTTDGRVLFAVPWMGKVVIGTTDVQVDDIPDEPVAHEEEVDFIIDNFNQYCGTGLRREDVQAVFAGLRPLIRNPGVRSTAGLQRDHTILVSGSGLITITGGKWTTYRKMAAEAVGKAATVAGLPARPCRTENIQLSRPVRSAPPPDFREERLHPDYPFTESDVLHALRTEMAMTVEDVLARRTRLLFLDSKAATAIAPKVAAILASELGFDQNWEVEQVKKFSQLAANYQL